MDVSRQQVLSYRLHAQELDRTGPDRTGDAAILDIGVQDTGADGAGWALMNRGVDPDPSFFEDLALVWTLRGAPHFYRRDQLAEVAAATGPFSDTDAAKRIFDAAKPLRAAGISPLEALDVVAGEMRAIVTKPTPKGDVSAELKGRLSEPYLRHCRPCNAIHCYEQPFRLAALRAGLELQPSTSPPILQRISGWKGPASEIPASLDVVRAYLHLLGPATPQSVAAFVDAPVHDVKKHWPADAVEVLVEGECRWVLADDMAVLASTNPDPGRVRLLSPFDLFLQARDRELLVPEADRRRALWVVLGRPGAVVVGSEIIGTWRPRASGRKLRLLVDSWSPAPEAALAEQAERLAAYRGVTYTGLAER